MFSSRKKISHRVCLFVNRRDSANFLPLASSLLRKLVFEPREWSRNACLWTLLIKLPIFLPVWRGPKTSSSGSAKDSMVFPEAFRMIASITAYPSSTRNSGRTRYGRSCEACKQQQAPLQRTSSKAIYGSVRPLASSCSKKKVFLNVQ